MVRVIIIAVFSMLAGILIGGAVVGDMLGSKMVYYKQLADKHLYIIDVFKNWLMVIEKGEAIDGYFKKNGFNVIAIYGMGYLGERLLKALEKTTIEVKYLIDQQQGSVYGKVPVYSISDNLEVVDVIVVTPVYQFYSIRRQLREKTSSTIISIQEIFRVSPGELKEVS